MRTAWLVVIVSSSATLGACSDDDTGASEVIGGDGATDGAATETSGDGTATATDTTATTATDTTATTATDTTATDTTATTATDTTAQDADTSGPVQICIPNAWVCASTSARHQCNADGTAFGPDELCGGGFSCRSGQCLAKCPNDPKFGVYVGCEFWATDLPNYPDPFVNPTPENTPWAIVVSNPGLNQVTVSFEMPPLFQTYTPPDPIVEPDEARVFELPNINVQGTSLMPKGVHVTATGPVTVHQFNPYDVRFSNDASLLVPDPMLGDEYVILSWPTSPLELSPIGATANQNGYFTIIAAFDDTTVTLQPSAAVRASGPIPALAPGQIHQVRLNRGDVLSIQTDPRTLFEASDPTGSRVTADKPISVFGGHEEAVVGEPIPNGDGGTTPPCCADHLEEQMLPVSLAGTSYFALHSPPRSQIVLEPDWWRIVALEPNVTITTDPPQEGANTTLGPIGDWVGFESTQSFTVSATGKVMVGQYTASRDMTEDFTGDPSLVLMIATDRFRKDYVFLAPDFETGGIFGTQPDLWATVVKKADVPVTVGGLAIAEVNFAPLGTTGYEYTYVRLLPGVHEASAPEPFGLYVYGYNNAVSFSYIGGVAVPGE